MSAEGTEAAPPGAGAPPPTTAQRLAAYRLLWIIAASVFALDQISKAWIASRLAYGTYGEAFGAIAVVNRFMYLVHVGNTGAAWSTFTGKSFILALLAAGTLSAIYVWRQALGLRLRSHQICFGLLCGGILGNLTDRILRHHVVDFIDLHFGTYVYPTFNVADSGICVGVLLYLGLNLRSADH